MGLLAAKTLESHLTYRYAKKFKIPYNINPNVFVPKKLFYYLNQKFLENDNLLLKLVGKIKKIYTNVTLIRRYLAYNDEFRTYVNFDNEE